MSKVLLTTALLALWSAAFALGGAEGGRRWQEQRAAQAAQPTKEDRKIEVKKARPLTVPIVHRGQMQGYVVAQLAYGLDVKAAAAFGAEVEPYLLDEAFTAIYADPSFDPQRLEAYDLERLKAGLEKRLAQRLKSDAVRDVLIQEFNYVAMSDLRR